MALFKFALVRDSAAEATRDSELLALRRELGEGHAADAVEFGADAGADRCAFELATGRISVR